ncbi:MAG: PadR family transcriptional regulator [Bacteroidota bacterium]
MYSKELLKGTLKTIVLNLLAEQGRLYGYEITRLVRERTDDQIQLTEGALYPTLHKLEADGLLTTETVNIGKRVRKYYALTQEGGSLAQDKVQEFEAFVTIMKRLLKPRTATS